MEKFEWPLVQVIELERFDIITDSEDEDECPNFVCNTEI